MKYVLVIAAFALSACNAAAPTTAPQTTQAIQAAAPVSSGSFMSFLNAARAQNGLPPVSEDARLTRSAQAHAADMQANDYFSHVGRDGSSFVDRAEAAGYGCVRAENIASGQRSPESVMTAWMNSPGHRANILRSNVTEFGIGRTDFYWVLVLGQGC